MNNLREVCWCGCSLATHHEGGQCLGKSCNQPSDDWYIVSVTSPCPWYRDDQKPDTLRKPHVKPLYHSSTCLCYGCKKAAA